MIGTWNDHLRRESQERTEQAPAPLCRWCGKTESEHKPEFVEGPTGKQQAVERLRMRMPCLGWRENFVAKEEA